jgi:hypothetical protein
MPAQEGTFRVIRLFVSPSHFDMTTERVVGVKQELAAALDELHGLRGLQRLLCVGYLCSWKKKTEEMAFQRQSGDTSTRTVIIAISRSRLR